MTKTKFIFTLILIIDMINLFGQNNLDKAINNWKNGEIKKAHFEALQVINESPDNEKAKYLLMKAWFVQGRYKEALQTFITIDKGYRKYKECVDLAIQANIHLRDYDNAFLIAARNKSKQLLYLKGFTNKRYAAIAEKTYYVPFLHDNKISSDYWPGVTGKINGVQSLFRFDTGGDYVIMGLSAAKSLGIELNYKSKSIHAAAKVTVWHSIIESMSFDNGPSFLNVPVTVMADMDDFIIFGTNILEQFLSTIDYHNNQFILTPRDNAHLIEVHYKMLSQRNLKVPFFLWDDHYMFAKGKLANNDSLNLFFDSGLIALNEVEGKLVQASFTASKESLKKWKFDKNNLKQNGFIPTKYSLSIENLNQPNTLIWFDSNLKKDRNFGGIRIDGLISHAWLKNYSWTIDFDKMEYTFGLK
ncbi:MAG: hypothetical protein EHM93_15390 [Bacteroidales bacterium]|nr:MAG: hypothetical protein EHM93_15390 [Bacteroidales bacterium]